MKKIVTIAVIVVVILVALAIAADQALRIGLNGARGDIKDVIAGQFEPGVTLKRDISATGAEAGNVYTVTISVDEKPMGKVSAGYLSTAIDSSQLVGGNWWNPDASGSEGGSGTVKTNAFDFNRPQLDTLAKALGPGYLRIGGSEADKIYYDMSGANGETVPEGYDSVLTASQWLDAANFAKRNGLKLVFTLNAGPSARDANGAWDPGNAESLLKFSAENGIDVAVWELGNELNLYWFLYGRDQQVSAAQYAADMAVARNLVKKYYPDALFSGQGSAYWPVLGEPLNYYYGFMQGYLEKAGSLTDIVAWHYYPQQSRRGPVATRRAFPARLLEPDNLNEAAYWASEVRSLRIKYAREAQTWVTETGNAQYGGEPGVSDAYIGGLWWLDELGLLAKYNTQVVVRQSLTGLNYGLIDEASLQPRPDYWNSVLWKRLMGEQVYNATVRGVNSDRLRVYVHSIPGQRSGVTVLVINLDPEKAAVVSLPNYAGKPFELYGLSSPDILGQELLLNGERVALNENGSLPVLSGVPVVGEGAAEITLNPLSYVFISYPPMIAVSLLP